MDFETWFEQLCLLVQEKTGVEFRDPDSVIDDFNQGRHFEDVADEIANEYGD